MVKVADVAAVRKIVAAVPDPEIPALSIAELGILRSVEKSADGRVTVTITPTHLGCPALDEIERRILASLGDAGITDVDVETTLAPAWTTDWLSPDAREKLRQQGIAPPGTLTSGLLQLSVACPRCRARTTCLVSRFGSAPCRESHYCNACNEPFEYFRAS
jgi:ring-1,2-phenylacetyl-CoA epoxidase subunit PaaD